MGGGLQDSETIAKPVVITDYSIQEKPLSILHVDDDVSILSVSKEILEKENKFEIDNATSVDEALKKLENQSYDAIISDYLMPRKNGLDFLRELREKNNNIPFILFIGEGRADIAIKALNLDADSYITKSGLPETVYRDLANAIKKTVERRKSKKLFAESDSKYRLLVEKSLQGIMIAQDKPLRIIFANDSMGKMLGYSPSELTSISSCEIGELIFQEDRAFFFDRFRNRLDGNQANSSYEFRALRKDGSVVWLEAFATLIEFDRKPAVQAMFLDISERKKTQEVLIRSEQRYRELSNSLPEIVFETDITGRITFFNQKAFEITGFSPDELKKGMNMLSFVVPEEQGKARENIAKLMTGKNPGTNEYTLLRKNGSTFPALVNTNAIVSETKVKGIRGIVIEITERKQMENKLEQYSKHLEELIETRTLELRKTQQQLVKSERFAAIGELAAIIGHDLRKPLRDIKNAIQFLRENSESLSEVQSQLLETIYNSVIHSNRTINDLLDYSTEIHLELKKNSLRVLILNALDFVKVPERVKILNNVPDTPYVIVDSDRITRVFINLIRNGIEAIPKEGSISINCKYSKDNVEISFTDSGIGISQEILPKIFSPIITDKALGMGFGLAICKRIVDAHAGTINIETSEGKGSTFTINLPFKTVSKTIPENENSHNKDEKSVHDCLGFFTCSEPEKCNEYRRCLKKYLIAETRNECLQL